LTLVTNTLAELERADGLEIKDWTQPYLSQGTVSVRPLFTDRHTASKAATVATMSASPIG